MRSDRGSLPFIHPISYPSVEHATMDHATDGNENQSELDTSSTLSTNDSGAENFEERSSNGRRPEDHWGNLEYECPVCGTWRMFCPGCGSSA